MCWHFPNGQPFCLPTIYLSYENCSTIFHFIWICGIGGDHCVKINILKMPLSDMVFLLLVWFVKSLKVKQKKTPNRTNKFTHQNLQFATVIHATAQFMFILHRNYFRSICIFSLTIRLSWINFFRMNWSKPDKDLEAHKKSISIQVRCTQTQNSDMIYSSCTSSCVLLNIFNPMKYARWILTLTICEYPGGTHGDEQCLHTNIQ